MGPRQKSSPIPSGRGKKKKIEQNINFSTFLEPQGARNKTGGSDN